ncbi:MAG: hypothetical protein CL831_06520 [Crocinitomicaceae bacterium]|nr:hypothetical protein [Crocinitomicaceae bacterium]
MSYHNYISRNIFVSFLAIAFLLASSMDVFAQEPDGLCCDPDGTNYQFINCLQAGCCGIYDNDGCVEDPDCGNYNPAAGCLTIPIEDGIPFLIIAGGVFAFYRLRDKKKRVVTEA